MDALFGASNRILGSGIFQSASGSAYKVYTGEAKPGGELVSDTEELALPDIFGPTFWLEKKK